jgi:hypothetical protein
LPAPVQATLQTVVAEIAAELLTRSTWYEVNRGLGAIAKTTSNRSSHELLDAIVKHIDRTVFDDIQFENALEAINFLECVRWQRPEQLREILPRLWSILPPEEAWSPHPTLLGAARFLFQLCLDQLVSDDDAERVVRVTAKRSAEMTLDNVSTNVLFLFLWNLYALWYERRKPGAEAFDMLHGSGFWDDLAALTCERIAKPTTIPEQLNRLALAGFVGFVAPDRRDELRAHALQMSSDSEYLLAQTENLRFVHSFFTSLGLALILPARRAFDRERAYTLIMKQALYAGTSAALENLVDYLYVPRATISDIAR